MERKNKISGAVCTNAFRHDNQLEIFRFHFQGLDKRPCLNSISVRRLPWRGCLLWQRIG